jgi:hypothetical protein
MVYFVNGLTRTGGLSLKPRMVLAGVLLALAGCSNVSEEASTQTIRLRQTETELSGQLTQQGWEVKKEGGLWRGAYSGSALTDEMLQSLQGFGRFAALDLSNQQLSKEQIKLISQLDDLMRLDLSGTNVTDEDLNTLNACPALMMIDVTDTQVTPAAAKAWVAARRKNNEIAFFARNPTVKTGEEAK